MVQFNPMMSAVANRLGYSKASYRRLGVIEIVGGFGILVGLASPRGSFGGALNEASAGVLRSRWPSRSSSTCARVTT